MAEDDMVGGGDVEIISPPNVIKSKVVEGGPGAVDADTLQRAVSVISDETDSYFELVKEDLVKLQLGVSDLKSNIEEP